jgi:arylsulfatase A-like enzyme
MPAGPSTIGEVFRTCLLVLAPLLLTTCSSADRVVALPHRPNVLFIAIDDLNDWTAFLGGHPGVETPNLDRIAARGVTFTRAYSTAPACNPSRTSLLTGRRPSTTGVYHNSHPWRPSMPDAVTLPQHFMTHGYHVSGGGKIFHGKYKDPSSWHEYHQRRADPVPPERRAGGIGAPEFLLQWGPVDVPDSAMADAEVVDWALRKLREPRDEPLFLAVGLFRPHPPWYVPRKYFDRTPLSEVRIPEVPDDDLDDVPEAGKRMVGPGWDHHIITTNDNWEKAVQGYLASIAFMDAQVGRLLDGLENGPYRDDTIIAIWGDNGMHLGEKKRWRKFTLWEEATRVPLLIAVPWMDHAGSRSDRTVSLLDLYPTLAELSGLPLPPELEGRSLRPLLEDPDASWDRPVLTTFGRLNHAIRSERWRYIRYENGSEELYDHDADPMEWTNLAGDPTYAGVKRDLAKWLPKVNAENASQSRQQKKKQR